MKKKGPYILIIGLIIFLVFVIGIRYGQKVEKTNKIIEYLISLPPSPTVQPTAKPLAFNVYENKLCGISFAYPTSLSIKNTSSFSASFSEKETTPIELTCEKDNDLEKILDTEAVATSELIFKGKKIIAKNPDQGHINVNLYVFKFLNTNNGKSIFAKIVEPFYPLFEKSLEFLK